MGAALLGILMSGCASGSAATPAPVGDASTRGSTVTSSNLSPATEDLSRHVLIIQESPIGNVTHSWLPVGEFDPASSGFQPRANGEYGHVVLATARERDCHAEYLDCFKKCMRTPLPRGFGHIRAPGRGMGAKEDHCTTECRQPYRDCEDAQGRRPQEFSTTEQAVSWLKRNRNEVLMGSLVVVAGVAFIVAFPPGAIIALVPVVSLASSKVACESPIAAVVVP